MATAIRPRLTSAPYRRLVVRFLVYMQGGRCFFCGCWLKRVRSAQPGEPAAHPNGSLTSQVHGPPHGPPHGPFPGWNDATIDHLRPRSQGGTDHIANLRLACRACNAAKRDDATHWVAWPVASPVAGLDAVPMAELTPELTPESVAVLEINGPAEQASPKVGP